jgi:hypothetical protein
MNIIEMFGDRWKEADLAQIPDGCPMLEEHRWPQTGDAIVELVIKRASMKPHDSRRYYRDSLWVAPPPPKRGSKLKVRQLVHLPIGSVVLDASGDSWHALQGYDGPEWWNVSAECEPRALHTDELDDVEYVLLHATKEAQ